MEHFSRFFYGLVFLFVVMVVAGSVVNFGVKVLLIVPALGVAYGIGYMLEKLEADR